MSCSLLLIEDHPLSREMFARALRRAKHNVHEAETGEAAVELLSTRRFNAVISDLRLPGSINGLDVLKYQKEKFPECKLLLVTGYGSNEAFEAAKALGAVYMEKPVSLEKMLSVIAA